MSEIPFGLLGTGYLGKTLIQRFNWPPHSWITHYQSTLPPFASKYPTIQFDWGTPETWKNLPDSPAILVLTIPPVYRDLEKEQERLHEWIQWMQNNRPNQKRMIYISSTGVYPNEDGTWTESSPIEEPTTLSGKLRLMTENLLSEAFETSVVRAGGIYGPNRNLITRVLNQKTVLVSPKPTHRIHVYDLAGLVRHLIHHSEIIPIANAVDHRPQPSAEVLRDLVEQLFTWNAVDANFAKTIRFETAPNANQEPSERWISNQLLKKIGYHLRYESYQACLGDIVEELTQAQLV